MHKNLIEFVEFLKNSAKQVSDLEFIPSSHEQLVALLGKEANKYIKVYFQNKASDLIGEWDIDGLFLENGEYPVVWMSSEGTPNTVVSTDFNEFLSLLPYGQGIIVGIPEYIKDYEKYPDVFQRPEIKYNEMKIKNALNYEASQFEGHAVMVEFLKSTLGINVNEAPFKTITEAIKKFPDFNQWVEENLT